MFINCLFYLLLEISIFFIFSLGSWRRPCLHSNQEVRPSCLIPWDSQWRIQPNVSFQVTQQAQPSVHEGHPHAWRSSWRYWWGMEKLIETNETKMKTYWDVFVQFSYTSEDKELKSILYISFYHNNNTSVKLQHRYKDTV